MTTIEFCFTGGMEDTKKAYETLQKDETLNVTEYGCLGNCRICRTFPYAKIDDELIIGEDAIDLVRKIYSKIAQQPDHK